MWAKEPGRDNDSDWVLPGTSLWEVDLTMSDQTSVPGNTGGEPNAASQAPDEDREAAMMRAVMRRQEEHREGGVDPELEDPSGDSQPGA